MEIAMCMRPDQLHRALGSTILATILFAFLTISAKGQDAEHEDKPTEPKVPVKRVVLFSSGVGFFEHIGKVDGDATVDLKFNVEDVNDLLKSMVLQDLDGGKISTVTYGSRDPITKTLQTFAIDLTQNPTLGQLLGQIRGEKVELEAPTKTTGTIVGVETKRQQVGDDKVIDVEYLNVLTDEGLRRIALDSISRIKLANKELDMEFRRALGILATGHATDKKTVTLKFLGDGERDVRVGYIQEAPVWKTSYRLVLDDEEKPFLQGWAIVENTTDTDWQDVNLSLVSGRPISFVMDLYSPLYAERPTVVPELHASLRPQVYDRDLREKEKRLSMLREQMSRSVAAREPMADSSIPSSGKVADGGSSFGGRAPADYFGRESLSSSVESAARTADVGELFQYDVKDAVSLPRQRSAMLPIINDTLEGEKVSIYNASVHAKHPLNGIELKNSSDLHLMQGPVTVFDGGVYAGDARIPDLPPGSDQLLSYALDLDVEVAPTGDSKPRDLLSARIEKGTFIATYKQSRTQKYNVKNSGREEKRLLVEHPIESQWELITPKEPTSKTRSVYRFAVDAKPGEIANLAIEEQIKIREDIAISNLNDEAIHFFLSANVVSETVKEALREVVRRKSELAQLQREKQRIDQEIASIGQEQQRIRENMRSIDRNTDLYNRYVKKFTDQEDTIEKLRDEGRTLEQSIVERQRSLDEYLSKLELG
jgi:hypothetical protein